LAAKPEVIPCRARRSSVTVSARLLSLTSSQPLRCRGSGRRRTCFFVSPLGNDYSAVRGESHASVEARREAYPNMLYQFARVWPFSCVFDERAGTGGTIPQLPANCAYTALSRREAYDPRIQNTRNSHWETRTYVASNLQGCWI